jgi:hypothetical protein
MHALIDQQAQDGSTEVYADDTFDEFDRETDELDSKLSDIPEIHNVRMEDMHKPLDDEWEDIDD